MAVNNLAMLEEYKSLQLLYADFAERLKSIAKDILDLNEINIVSIEARAKSTDSLKSKIEARSETLQELVDIKDLAGVRVIALTRADAEKIEEQLSACFDVEESTDEGAHELDKIGYRSKHLVVSLPNERCALPEYKKFKGLKAELQIRTVLEHAWAQIGHDQVYKQSSVLPEEIRRDFNLLAGLLEIADKQFSRLTGEISRQEKNVAQKTRQGDLNIPIDSISLRGFLSEKFKGLSNLDPRFGPQDNMAEEIISELKAMGINTLQDLNSVIPEDYKEKAQALKEYNNFCGITRDIMIIHDAKKYFEGPWKNKWAWGRDEGHILSFYGIDRNELAKKYQDLES